MNSFNTTVVSGFIAQYCDLFRSPVILLSSNHRSLAKHRHILLREGPEGGMKVTFCFPGYWGRTHMIYFEAEICGMSNAFFKDRVG